jgi:Family of unknown function (DUF6328)
MTDMSETPATPGREETHLERLDRNTVELLQELRVVATGIQVLFGFLLIVPFNTGFRRVTSFQETVYFVALLCIAVSSVLLLAPTIHHRILFRQGEKAFLVRVGNQLSIAAMVFLWLGFTAILVVVADFVVGAVAAVVVGTAAILGIGALWFAFPLARRAR